VLDFVLDFAQERSIFLQQKYDHYFFPVITEQYGWIRNPISANAQISKQELSLPVRKNNLDNSEIKIQRCST